MRVDGFWMGLVELSPKVKVADLARRAGGWAHLREAGPSGWIKLGLTESQASRLGKAGPSDSGGQVVTAEDPGYPAALASCSNAPPVLFVEGDVQALQAPAVAVVGTRRCSSYGGAVARDLGYQLANAGVAVVSGLARGIDAAAHGGAVASGCTIAVLGHGLQHTAPLRNRGLRRQIVNSGGALVTTWPDDVEPRPWTFPVRNQWIAGLSSHTVVVEAPHRSGAMHTVRAALDYGRQVAAVPGPIGAPASEGCNQLIVDGAISVLSVPDFVGMVTGIQPVRDRWLSALFTGCPLEEVAKLRGGSVAELIEELQLLEALGQVVRLPGQRYATV